MLLSLLSVLVRKRDFPCFFFQRQGGPPFVLKLLQDTFIDVFVSESTRTKKLSSFFSTLSLAFFWLLGPWIQQALVQEPGANVAFLQMLL